MGALLVAIMITATWWLICVRVPRVGAIGSVVGLAYFTVGLFRDRNNCLIDPVMPADGPLATVLAVAPLLAVAIGLAIAVTRWTEAR